MSRFPVISVACGLGWAAFVLLALPAAAQQTIQFTKPVDKDLPGKANAVTPPTTHRISAEAFNAPSPLFGERNSDVSFDVLQGSPNPGPVSAASAEQWRKILDGKKNWTLQTPEEILGIQTPEKILGLTDPRDDPKLSAEERFLQRRERRETAGMTNRASATRRPDASPWQDDPATLDLLHAGDPSRRFAQALGGSGADPVKILNSIFNDNNNSSPNPLADLNRKPDSAWASPFGLPGPLPKQTPEQLEGMDRFRALMEPAVPEKTAESSRVSLPLIAAPNPNMQVQPAFNPAGRSFSALESSIAKPKGLTPLPGITGPHPEPAKKTASLVQPPPWMQDSPQASSPPQRQF
jgi:hypothetical protein